MLALKHNLHHLHTEVIAAFTDDERGTFTPEAQDCYKTVEHYGGHTEQGTCMVKPRSCAMITSLCSWD